MGRVSECPHWDSKRGSTIVPIGPKCHGVRGRATFKGEFEVFVLQLMGGVAGLCGVLSSLSSSLASTHS